MSRIKTWHLQCDRNGMLVIEDRPVPGLLPLAVTQAYMLTILPNITERAQTGGVWHWAVPGVQAAGEDDDAAIEAVIAFKRRLDAVLAANGQTIC